MVNFLIQNNTTSFLSSFSNQSMNSSHSTIANSNFSNKTIFFSVPIFQSRPLQVATFPCDDDVLLHCSLHMPCVFKFDVSGLQNCCKSFHTLWPWIHFWVCTHPFVSFCLCSPQHCVFLLEVVWQFSMEWVVFWFAWCLVSWFEKEEKMDLNQLLKHDSQIQARNACKCAVL